MDYATYHLLGEPETTIDINKSMDRLCLDACINECMNKHMAESMKV